MAGEKWEKAQLPKLSHCELNSSCSLEENAALLIPTDSRVCVAPSQVPEKLLQEQHPWLCVGRRCGKSCIQSSRNQAGRGSVSAAAPPKLVAAGLNLQSSCSNEAMLSNEWSTSCAALEIINLAATLSNTLRVPTRCQ